MHSLSHSLHWFNSLLTRANIRIHIHSQSLIRYHHGISFKHICHARSSIIFNNKNNNCVLVSTLNCHSRQIFRFYTFTPKKNIMATNQADNNHREQPFRPKKALVVAKLSRYEFEKRRHPGKTEEELTNILEKRGSDYETLVKHHNVHVESRDMVVNTLKSAGIQTKMVNRFDYTEENIDWADLIVTSGGDGTFLMAASKVNSRDKPIIGVNSDPSRSVGYLCLPKRYSNNFDEAVAMMSEGRFRWKYRQRIRVTLEGEHAFDEPIELYNQKLMHPEYRFLDLEPRKTDSPMETTSDDNIRANNMRQHVLPYRALNEVFVGESLSSRVSYYELSLNGEPKVKIKSSGLTVCTGTGSSSWSFNINKVTPQCVQSIFKIVNEKVAGVNLPVDANSDSLIQTVTETFNNSLLFDPSKPVLAYTIRDPIVFGTNFDATPRGFADRIEVKSRMFEATITIDGGLSYMFNDGAKASFQILPEDSLRTLAFKE